MLTETGSTTTLDKAMDSVSGAQGLLVVIGVTIMVFIFTRMVGDPAQTIYSFAGADARYLREFTQRFPSATSVELVRNYRSTPQIVGAAPTLGASAAERNGQNWRAAVDEARRAVQEGRAGLPDLDEVAVGVA